MMAEAPSSRAERRKPERPLLVTLLALVVLSITVIHLTRFINSLTAWEFLSSLTGVSPLYLALTGLVGVLVSLPLFWGLWRGHPKSPLATLILAVAYTIYEWLERSGLIGAGGLRPSWPFAAGVTLILLIFIFWVLSRPNAKAFFGEMHEQSFKSPTIART